MTGSQSSYNAAEMGHRTGRVGLSLLIVAALLGTGCSSRRADSMTLVLISPHREEIREEVRWAFQQWFQERTAARVEAARTALVHGAAENSFRELFADWRRDDLSGVWPAFEAWQHDPSRSNGQALLAALEQWQKQLRPVQVVWIDVGGGTSQIARYVSASFEQAGPEGGIGIDILFGGGTDIYLRFAAQGLLQKVELPRSLFHDRIPTQLNGVDLYDQGGRWYGAMLSSFGILSNRWVLERVGLPEPQQWTDLGRPEFRSWVSAGDPRLSGSVHMVYEIILQGRGWEEGFRLLMRLGANTHSIIGDSGTLTRMVTLGEVATAGNVDANALIALAREPRWMTYHLPAGETIINPDAIAVLRGARRPELAKAFLEFVLSDAGQLLFLLQPGQPGGPRRHPLCRLSIAEPLYSTASYRRYPVDTRSVGDANPFSVHNLLRYDSQQGNRRWNALNDLLGAVIVDAQPELAAAWEAVLHSRLPADQRQRLEEELFRPFCTAAELAAHGRAIEEQGPRLRAETVNRWGEQARQRYARIRRTAQE
jgi:ABC-type Fe3+ transport system substrate-binding protein